jgi:hypothetical protein
MSTFEKDAGSETDQIPQYLEHELHQDDVQKLQVTNVDLAAAITANRVSPWSRGSLKLYTCCGLVYCARL